MPSVPHGSWCSRRSPRSRHLSRWWGPEGFTTTTRAFEFRVGGAWDFVMHGPDGTDYQEWISWTEITPPERIALLHGESRGDPNAFESVLTFASDGAVTRIKMRTVFPTKELRDEAVERYGAIEGGRQTLANLDAYVTEIARSGRGGLMAGKVFFSVSMSLDGFIAPASLGDLMGQQWMELQQWVFPQRFFRENLSLGEGGEEGRDNDILRETFERTGASVMGKRMFDAGEQMWPEEAPFHTPVFVVTHQRRDPWERPGGTTFHFVNDGVEAALDQAREAAGDRDVRIAGGGATILEYVNAGLVDEFSIALSPVLFGSGIRLFEGVDAGRVALEPVRAEHSPRVTHLTYAVRRRGSRVAESGGARGFEPLTPCMPCPRTTPPLPTAPAHPKSHPTATGWPFHAESGGAEGIRTPDPLHAMPKNNTAATNCARTPKEPRDSHRMALSTLNLVELRGFEPLTPCMPCPRTAPPLPTAPAQPKSHPTDRWLFHAESGGAEGIRTPDPLHAMPKNSTAATNCARKPKSHPTPPDGPSSLNLVELRGFEPLTPCMPCKCATNCATAPDRVPPVSGQRRES